MIVNSSYYFGHVSPLVPSSAAEFIRVFRVWLRFKFGYNHTQINRHLTKDLHTFMTSLVTSVTTVVADNNR